MLEDQLETMSHNGYLEYATGLETRLAQHGYFVKITAKLAGKPPKYLTDSEKQIIETYVRLCFFSNEKQDGDGYTWVSHNLIESKTGKATRKNQMKMVIEKLMKRNLFIYKEEKRTRGKGFWVLVPDDFLERLDIIQQEHNFTGGYKTCPCCGKRMAPIFKVLRMVVEECSDCHSILSVKCDERDYQIGEIIRDIGLSDSDLLQAIQDYIDKQKAQSTDESPATPQVPEYLAVRASIDRRSTEAQNILDLQAQARVEENLELADTAIAQFNQEPERKIITFPHSQTSLPQACPTCKGYNFFPSGECIDCYHYGKVSK
jgi:hypothetical protein